MQLQLAAIRPAHAMAVLAMERRRAGSSASVLSAVAADSVIRCLLLLLRHSYSQPPLPLRLLECVLAVLSAAVSALLRPVA